jgi:mandelamide amidase
MTNLSAVDAVAGMQSGSIAAEQYALALLEQCERGKALNAFITLDREKVLADARAADQKQRSGAELGPLHGLPIPIKDSVNTKDLPTTVGTEALRHFYPKENAPIVQTLLDAGAIILGKTNLHELSMGWTSNNYAFGAVRNPYDLTRIPGGSSGGTAAAIASHMAPLGVAEDTEGSIRVPAALCGIAGFRATTGRYSTKGCAPISSLFDQVGPLARNVGDLVLFDKVAAGNFDDFQPGSLMGLKLGVIRDYWFVGLHPEVERVTDLALKKMVDAGVVLVESQIPDLALLIQNSTPQVQLHDVLVELPQYLLESGSNVTFEQLVEQASPELKAFFADCQVSEADYQAARDIYLPELRRSFQGYFARSGVSAIVFPTTMVPATPIGIDETVPNFVTAMARNIAPGSTAGLPGLVLPSGFTKSGLPVSIEFDGPAGMDRELLSLGLSFEVLFS